MKRLWFVIALLFLLMAIPAVVYAQDGSWTMYMKTYNAAGTGNSSGFCKLGLSPTALNGFKSFEDTYLNGLNSDASAIYCTDLGLDRMWNTDKRQSLSSLYDVRIWHLKLKVENDFPDDQALLKVWFGSGAAEVYNPNDILFFRFDLSKGNTVVHSFNGAIGSEANPVYSTLVDVSPGETVDFTVFYGWDAPEPSSIIAMLAGLSGLGGFMWRRRK